MSSPLRRLLLLVAAVAAPCGAAEPATAAPPVRLLDFNGDLKSLRVAAGGLDLRYESASRAFATTGRKPVRLEIDGRPAGCAPLATRGGYVLALPRGIHQARIEIE